MENETNFADHSRTTAGGFVAVCSARPRPAVHTGRKGGNQWWARDVYHMRRESDPARTRCGLDCSEWLVIGRKDEPTDDCCTRCLSKSGNPMSERILGEGM